VRTDGLPLLPVRDLPAARPLVVRREPPAPSPASGSTRGLQLFTALEGSHASDESDWFGVHVGVCVAVGPVCAAFRMRAASTVPGNGMFTTELERHSIEILGGFDVPFAIGGFTFAPGFAAGWGTMKTISDDEAIDGRTSGPRADVHATFMIPLSKKWSLDLAMAFDLTQETRREVATEMPIPEEPIALLRYSIGVRWGQR
jgi:hypothetical protein